MIKRIRKMSLILICSVLIGVLLLFFVFLLPVDSARRHAEESLYDMMDVLEDPDGSVQRKKIVSIKENFTDFLMVQNALEKVEGKSLLEHVMYIYHHDLGNEETWITEASLVRFLREGSDGMYLREYSRYWHGYLVVLKPLLMCMSWMHVELLLFALQAALLFVIVLTACRRHKFGLGIGIVCAFLFMKPLRMGVSLTMSVCSLITLMAVWLLLYFFDLIEKKDRRENFFLLVGIATAYMDFLTYPVVTLGLPLCVWLVQSSGVDGERWKKLWRTFGNCVCWSVGYVGMWGMKWIVAEITCQTGTLRNAVWAVIHRTSPLDGYGSVFSGVSRTFSALLDQYDSVFYQVGFWLIAIAALISGLTCLVKAYNVEWGISILCLAVVALLPVGWLILTQNHTAIHCIFTFRIFGVSVMALWCMTCLSVSTVMKKYRT